MQVTKRILFLRCVHPYFTYMPIDCAISIFCHLLVVTAAETNEKQKNRQKLIGNMNCTDICSTNTYSASPYSLTERKRILFSFFFVCRIFAYMWANKRRAKRSPIIFYYFGNDQKCFYANYELISILPSYTFHTHTDIHTKNPKK